MGRSDRTDPAPFLQGMGRDFDLPWGELPFPIIPSMRGFHQFSE